MFKNLKIATFRALAVSIFVVTKRRLFLALFCVFSEVGDSLRNVVVLKGLNTDNASPILSYLTSWSA
jgi:hypothetical protein